MINIGIFSLSSCSGCLIEFLNLEEKILDVLKFADIKEAQIMRTDVHDGNFDIIFVEGSPTTPHQVENLLSWRARTKILIALGTCSSLGGVQTMIDDTTMREAVMKQYGGTAPLISFSPKPIAYYVKVEYSLYGCPFERSELIELLKAVVFNKNYKDNKSNVCKECLLRENGCLLDIGDPCLGPITRAGCDARCPSNGMYCTGCRGEYEDMNMSSHQAILKGLNYTDEDIKRMYNKYYRRLK